MIIRTQGSLGRCFGPAGIVRAIGLLLLLTLFAAAAPTTRRSAPPESDVVRWLAELDHRTPAVRTSATAQLMQLSREDLPLLKTVMQKARPLSPAQTQVLHDVVLQVYLSGEPYDRGDGGFLGMQMAPFYRFGDPQADDEGVVVQSRITGFGAYRALLDGDIITKIEEQPAVRLGDPQTFSTVVRGYSAGTTLHLTVLRQGHQMHIPVTLDARPAILNTASNVEYFNASRVLVAEDYWDKEFAAVAGESVSRVD